MIRAFSKKHFSEFLLEEFKVSLEVLSSVLIERQHIGHQNFIFFLKKNVIQFSFMKFV